MLRHLTALALVTAALVVASPAQARWLGGYHPQSKSVTYVKKNLWHAQTTILWLKAHKGAGTVKSRAVVHKNAVYLLHWAQARLSVLQTPQVDYWIAKQIRIATLIGQASGGDPWPNCPDPFDGGGPWWNPAYPNDKSTTLGCENGGNWYDSPGYYRCGLQFDPGWETKYGRLCP